MDTYVFLLSRHWRQLVGFTLTLAGSWILQAGPGLESIVQAFGMTLFAVGWMASVFGFFTWPASKPGESKWIVRVYWPGFLTFVIAAALPVAFDAYHRGWSQQRTEFVAVASFLAFGTAIKGMWDRRTRGTN